MESAASGLVAGLNAARSLEGKPPLILPQTTMTGALALHISETPTRNFQPMGANFGLLPPLEERIKDKQLRYETLARRGFDDLNRLLLA